MGYFFNTSDINQTFIIEGMSISGSYDTISATTINGDIIYGNTISASTYLNLPLDIFITGGTFDVSNKLLSYKTNDDTTVDLILPVRVLIPSSGETIDNTPILIDTISGLTDNSNCFVISYVNAYKDEVDYGFWKRTLSINKVSGVVNIIGENSDFDRISSGMTPNSVVFSADSSNITINVIGESAKYYVWSSNWEIIK